MKKVLTLLASCVWSVAAMATNYTGTLTVINGQQSQETATITIEDNNVTIADIAVTNCASSTVNGITTLVKSNSEMKLVAHVGYNSQYATVELKLANGTTYLFQNVADAFQMPNGDFETWTASSGEPQHWHGFNSASGTWAKLAPGSFGKSTDVHPGSTGKYSAVAKSGSAFGVIGNGTFTNGQLNAGSTNPSASSNHSKMDKTSTATDKDGNPYYTALLATPDSIKTWFKFTQATPNASYPYATISAILFDGTYYQDPEDKNYTNVAGKAQNKTIQVTDWKEISIPFDFSNYTGECKAILVTMSTNATPGKGSSGDQIFADDITLVYNAQLTGVTFKGQQVNFTDGKAVMGEVSEAPLASDFTIACNGAAATSGCIVEETENGYVAHVYVVSGDLLTTEVRTIEFGKSAPAGKVGDVNADNTVDVSDINCMVGVLLGNTPAETYEGRADVNNDGKIDVSDINMICQQLLSQQ